MFNFTLFRTLVLPFIITVCGIVFGWVNIVLATVCSYLLPQISGEETVGE